MLPLVQQSVDLQSLLERFFGETEFRGSLTFCPFHEHTRNTPSFSVFSEGRKFRCHTCEARGDVIDFFQFAYKLKTGRSLAFNAAVRALAQLAGIVVDQTVEGLRTAVAALRIAPRPGQDQVRKALVEDRRAVLSPLILAVRNAGTSGSHGLALWLAEEFDRTADAPGITYGSVIRRLRALETTARRCLRDAERVVDWETPADY